MPSGYHDASPGAEDLIGWHLNNGKERAADFFPLSRFRSARYRPGVVVVSQGLCPQGSMVAFSEEKTWERKESYHAKEGS